MREKKERKRLNKKKLNNLTRYIQCFCLFGYVGCNEKEGSKREFLGKMKSEGETQSSGIYLDVTLRPRSVQNVSPITLPLSTTQAGVWPQVFPHSSSHVAALYMALSLSVCVQFCSHCMCSLADPQEHCTRFVTLTYPSDCSKDGSWFLAGFWIRSHIYKVTSTELKFITKAHLKNKTQNAE